MVHMEIFYTETKGVEMELRTKIGMEGWVLADSLIQCKWSTLKRRELQEVGTRRDCVEILLWTRG
jgi:hypothetical protein